MNERIKRKLAVATVAAVFAASAALLAVPAAFGAELTRDEYVARVEPICKRNTEANRRIFAGAKGEVKAGELKKASKRFFRAAGALEKAIGQLDSVPKPPPDAAKLSKWIGYLEREGSLIGEIGGALAKGSKGKAQGLSVRLRRNSNLANNTVLGFDFDYCRIDPSRFS
jgi:hypothetical protein